MAARDPRVRLTEPCFSRADWTMMVEVSSLGHSLMRRPDPKTWILFALVAVAVNGCNGRDEPSPADAASPVSINTPSCPTGLVVEVELAAWKQAIEGMTHWPIEVEPENYPDAAPAYDALLGELGLEPLPDRTLEVMIPGQGVMSLVAVDITPLRRGGSEAPDMLVAIRFRNTAGAESLRAQVLRPHPGSENVYCSLGDDLSHEKEVGEQPCIEEHRGFARSLSIVSLVAPDRDAIMVRDAGGWCGSGTQRGDRFTTAYWGVENDRLVRYLEVVTSESSYESPDPPAKVQLGRIELSDTWPRAITITEITECLHVDGDRVMTGDCKPFGQKRTYQYIGNLYVMNDGSGMTE